MKLIPILYSAAMAKALRDGRKTETRRIIKPQPNENGVSLMVNPPLDWQGEWFPWKWETEEGASIAKHCPYGEPGDILWGRENFYAYGFWIINGVTKKTGKPRWEFVDLTLKRGLAYKYSDAAPDKIKKGYQSGIGWYKRNSLFMPYGACRLFHRVVEVKVEALLNISNRSALAEGIEVVSEGSYKVYGNSMVKTTPVPRVSYMSLWDSINGKVPFNPWVWVVKFKETKKPTI